MSEAAERSTEKNKRDKTLKKLEVALQAGDFYQAHQIYRSVCNRYYNQKNYGKAIEMLYEGSLKLLEYEQYASAADLGTYLTKAYTASNTQVDPESSARIIAIIKEFPSSEKTRGFLITAALDWATKFGSLSSGEPLFHDALAAIYERDGNFLMAENHYVFGTEETSKAFAGLLYRWASLVEPLNFGYFLARAVLCMIDSGNATKATLTTRFFVAELIQHKPDLVSPDNSTDLSNIGEKDFVEFNVPLLNFIQLLVLLLPKAGARSIFSQMRERYQAHLVTPAYSFSEVLDKIGEDYFGIRIHRPVNLLQSLMSNMFNPGSGAQNAGALPFGQLTQSNTELD
ncbi:hypothetical protein DSO57_1037583 [Entomophthora muscae]|uniref:Uncharacterized protein n=2 Tax=Entomophthora muscae TaxID=34485 RepID=A0ACC2TKV3_9FUNG|nr:hypothetical protein DSO57_1037583 [Entomophthora muscae]